MDFSRQAQRVLNNMPKEVFSDFSGGLSQSDRQGFPNQFWVGRNVDIFTNPGYVQPGWRRTNISVSGLGSNKAVREIVVDGDNGYLFTDDQKAYQITSVAADTFNANVDGSNNTSKTVTNMSGDMKGIIYYAKDNTAVTKFLFLCYNTAGNILRVKLGQANPYSASNLITDFLTNATYLNSSALDTNGARDVIEFQNYLFFTNGRYISKYDGNGSGNYGDWTAQFFDLGVGWSSDCLFVTGNYLGICASKNKSTGYVSECRVYLIDLSSNTLAVKIIPLVSLSSVSGVKNKGGTIYIFGDSKNKTNVVGKLTDEGFEPIHNPITEAGNGTSFYFGSLRYLGTGHKNTIDVLQENLIFGLDTNAKTGNNFDLIYALTPNEKVFSPFSGNSNLDSLTYIRCLKVVLYNKMYVSSADGGFFSLLSNNEYGYGGASLKTLFKEYGQKIRINYIKVYFRIGGSSDSNTVFLDINNGMPSASGTKNVAIPLGMGTGNISYGNDGGLQAVSKRFDIKQICHSYRLSFEWGTASATMLQKMVVDYDFVDDL